MRTIRNSAALLLAVVLALAFASCGRQRSGDTLKARFSALVENDTLEQILAEPAQHADEIAAFGLDDFEAAFADADAYRSYTVEISVQNTNDFAVQLLHVQMETKNQGKNGVWFAAQSETMQMGLPAQYTGDEALYYTVIASTLLSKEDILQTLGEMGVSCVFMKGSEAPDMDAQIDPALLYTSVILCKE